MREHGSLGFIGRLHHGSRFRGGGCKGGHGPAVRAVGYRGRCPHLKNILHQKKARRSGLVLEVAGYRVWFFVLLGLGIFKNRSSIAFMAADDPRRDHL